MATFALIMAGGSGTRFWPASRRAKPKQLLALGGPRPLLRDAVDRVVPLCGPERVLVSVGRHLVEPTLAVLPELARSQLLVEPVGRNTAPCIAWGAAEVARRDPDGVVMALPSDPWIRDGARFRDTLGLAVETAKNGTITTIGIRPTHPETGYGYIEAAGDGAVLAVERFVEKPTREKAEQFLASGRFYWNAGMFFFRARDMVAAIEKHVPELGVFMNGVMQGMDATGLEAIFATLPSVSIDKGVMEKVERMSVVPGDFGWTDLGSWQAVGDLAPADLHGNAAPESAVLVDSARCYVDDRRTTPAKRTIALVGVQDLCVVATDDAILVMPRNEAQRVREVVDELTRRADDDLV
jgi:mannose-1-phosphate guanylyltransferase